MKRTRLVFLLLDQSAVDAFFNDQIDIATLGQDYGALKLLTPVFTLVPPEEDPGAFQVIAEGSDPDNKDAEFERRYFICYDTSRSAPVSVINALVDKIKHVGNNYTYIDTRHRDMRTLWRYLPKPNNQQQESNMDQKPNFHPKTVNLILSEFNASAALHDGRYNIAGLTDEMVARGGQIFTFRQKGQTDEEIAQEANRLLAHLKDPQRHPGNQYIIIANTNPRKVSEEADAAIKQTEFVLRDTVKEGDVNYFSFGDAVPHSRVAEILYTALYQMLTPPMQFKNPIVPPNTITPEAMHHIRQQLNYATSSLQAIGMALTLQGFPGAGANFQAFGRGGRPFPGQPVGFGANGEGMLFGGYAGIPPIARAMDPASYANLKQEWQEQFGFGTYEENQVRFGSGLYPQNLYGSGPYQPFPPAGFGSEMHGFAPPRQPQRTFSPFKPLFDYTGNVLVHYVGAAQDQLAKQLAEFAGMQMPNATIIPVAYDDTQELDTIVDKVAEHLAWREQKANVHLVMMTSADPNVTPSSDVIAQGIYNSISNKTPRVVIARAGEIITGPVMLQKLLSLVTNMVPHPYPGGQRFGAVRPAAGYRAQPQLSVDDLAADLRKFDGLVVFHSVGGVASSVVEDVWSDYISPIMTSADFKHYNYGFSEEGKLFQQVQTNIAQSANPKQLHVVVSDARFATTSETPAARLGYQVHAAISQKNFAVGLATPEELRVVSTTLDNLYHLKAVQEMRANQKF